MSNNIRNIKKGTSELFNLATSTFSWSVGAVASTPGALVEVVQLPFSASVGYLMESNGLSEEEATAVAYRVVNAPIRESIKKVGQGSGKLIAQLMEDDADEANAKS